MPTRYPSSNFWWYRFRQQSKVLNFPSIDPVYTETNSSFPDYWPFGHFKIIELHGDTFNCEDLSGNILRWERV